jgi:hypothetical protein
MDDRELREKERQLLRAGARRLLPVALAVLLVLYLVMAYLSHQSWQQLGFDHDYIVERGETTLAAVAAGSTSPPTPHRADKEDAVAALRRHYGIDSEDIASYRWKGERLVVCPDDAKPTACTNRTGFTFALAYTYQVMDLVLRDVWNLVFAPVRDGRFTRDPVRILYRIDMGGASEAVLLASADFGVRVVPEPIVGRLIDFDESQLAQRLGALANEDDAQALNPLGLKPAEMRVMVIPKNIPIPGHSKVAALVDGPLANLVDWTGANGDEAEMLNRILALCAALGLLIGVTRISWRFLRFAAKWRREWHELERASGKGEPAGARDGRRTRRYE